MVAGLSVSDVTNVDIVLSPLAVPVRNFGALAIVGNSDVIDINERVRQYATLDGVASDFGTTAPEYLAADLFFAQEPQPALVYIGRFADTATAGELRGAVMNSAAQAALITTLQGITTGGLVITVDGTVHTLSNLDFSGIVNLNGAASVLQTAIASGTVVWDATYGRFVVKSATSGPTSLVLYATNPGSGAPLATDMGLTQAAGAVEVAGQNAESAVAALTAVAGKNSDIYGLMFALPDGVLNDTDALNLAAYVEGSSPSHIFGWTTQDVNVLDSDSTTDVGSLLKAGNYSRTFWQYCSSSPYAVASMFGRAFTVDFTAQNSTITLKFKQEPGITAEVLTESQAAAIKAKNGNVFVQYMNDTAIIQEGVMSNGYFFDERHGTDWLQNNVQTAVWNLLYQSPTKIPQTDAGVHQIVAVVEQALEAGVNNGLIAPGVWNTNTTIGKLSPGMVLTKGYYVFAGPVAGQSQADREVRKAPTLQCAIKLAGAVHTANVIVNVNR